VFSPAYSGLVPSLDKLGGLQYEGYQA